MGRIIPALIKLTIIGQFFFATYCREKTDYNVQISFVDSTFVKDRETYNTGEKVYVLATEDFRAKTPDTVEVIIKSTLGDSEIVRCCPPENISVIPEIDVHGGYILNQVAAFFKHNNGVIEVKSSGDTIQGFYEVKNQRAVDTAYIINNIK